MFTQKELNLRKRRYLGLLKHCDMTVLYYPGKANVVVDALNRLSIKSVYHVKEAKNNLNKEVHRLVRVGVRFEYSLNCGFIVCHNSESSLIVDVKTKQHLDKPLMELKEVVLGKHDESFSLVGMVS